MADTFKKTNKKHKWFYQLKLFWFLVFASLVLSLLYAINFVLNNNKYQEKAADLIYKLTQTELGYTDIHFNLLRGEIKGTDLVINVEKVNLSLSLKEFKISYNPAYLLIGRFKITEISAKEFWLDTSQLKKQEKQVKKIKMPDFLQRIRLKQAKIEKFFWNQPKGARLSIDNLILTSKFGSVLYKSPLQMHINHLDYNSEKLDAFVEKIVIDGFFLFDFTQPRIFDESKLSITTDISKLLLAMRKEPKPWLTDRGWDADLDQILKKYYPNEIPTDRTYLFIQNIFFDAQKTAQNITLNTLKIKYGDSDLIGDGSYHSFYRKIKFKIKTLDPMLLSKLPLGQSKFRQSFERFSIDLKADGIFNNLKNNSLNVDLKAKLHGNLVQPEAGDISAELTGKLTNGQLVSNDLTVKLKDGSLTGNTKLDFNELTTQTQFTAHNIEAQTVIRLFSSINIPAQVDATGSVTGKLSNPKIVLDMTTPNASYEFLNFGDANGKLIIQDKNLDLNVQTTGNQGQAQLKLIANNVFSSFEQVMKLTSTYSNIDLQKTLNAKSLKGIISGKFDLQRIKAKVSATGDFKAQNFEFFDQPVGDISFKTILSEKHLEIKPIVIDLLNPKSTITSNKGLVFDFDLDGYNFKGNIVDQLLVSGTFKKDNKNFIQLKFVPTNMKLDLFASLLPVKFDKSALSGTIDANYQIYNPYLSTVKANIKDFELATPDGIFKLSKPSYLEYNNNAFVFKNFDIKVGQGRIVLNGPLGLENNSALSIKGDVDFTPLTDINPFISESETPIKVDVTLKENIYKPKIYGKVIFENDAINFRKLLVDLYNINGTLKFDGNKVSMDKLTLDYDDAPVELSGFIITDYEKITGANLAIKGREIPLHPYDGLSLLTDVKLTLKGQNLITLEGDVNIVEGQYNRNFSITNFIISPSETEFEEEGETLAGLPLNTKYKLQIKNTGDLLIDNNVATLEMNADLELGGTIENPDLVGQIEFLGGQIHAFGIDFDNATGFAQFKRGQGLSPEINLTARKEIQEYIILARVEGKVDNLRLRLDSTPALSRREILSVVFFGQTPDQLDEESRRNFTQTAAISQLATILADPLNKISGLDLLQVTSRRESSNDRIQRLTVGKHLTNRFDLAFTADLGITDPERAFELRYQIFDNFYLITAKDVVGGNRYRFEFNYRFTLY